MGRLDGKIATVTGGASGIGEATVRRFVAEGASVAFCDRDGERGQRVAAELEAAGAKVAFTHADVGTEAACLAFINGAAQKFGRLDILVNNAGIRKYEKIDEASAASWNEILSVNLLSYVACAKAAVPLMRRNAGGAIVNVASVQGFACQQNVAAYATTKGAIHTLTRSLALDYAAAGIRVNSVSPGSIRTPILEKAARGDSGSDADVEEAYKRFGAAHPLGRIGEPEEVAELIAFLCSSKAGFCTGADYRIDGGLTAGIGVK